MIFAIKFAKKTTFRSKLSLDLIKDRLIGLALTDLSGNDIPFSQLPSIPVRTVDAESNDYCSKIYEKTPFSIQVMIKIDQTSSYSPCLD